MKLSGFYHKDIIQDIFHYILQCPFMVPLGRNFFQVLVAGIIVLLLSKLVCFYHGHCKLWNWSDFSFYLASRKLKVKLKSIRYESYTAFYSRFLFQTAQIIVLFIITIAGFLFYSFDLEYILIILYLCKSYYIFWEEAMLFIKTSMNKLEN